MKSYSCVVGVKVAKVHELFEVCAKVVATMHGSIWLRYVTFGEIYYVMLRILYVMLCVLCYVMLCYVISCYKLCIYVKICKLLNWQSIIKLKLKGRLRAFNNTCQIFHHVPLVLYTYRWFPVGANLRQYTQ